MTRGWRQEIPIRHLYTSGDHYAERLNPTEDDGDRSVKSMSRSGVVYIPLPSLRRQQRARWSNPKESSRLPEHEHGYTLTLKSPPKQLAKPIATYSYSTNQDTQPRQGLKTWERAGSVISNPGGSLHQRGPATMQRSVSQPRTMGYDNVFGTTNGRTNYPTQQNGLANSQGQPNSMKQRDLAKSENNPFNHPFFYSNGNKDLSSTGPPPLVTTVDNIDGSIVQDSFKWQKERKNLNTKNGILPTQIDNNTTYYTIRRPPRPGTNFPPADNSDKIDLPVYHSDSMQGKSKPVPFTKRTGKKGQEHFLRLMKPVPDRSNEPALGRVFSLPLFPRRQAEHFDEQPDHRIIGQPDDEVTYENLPFQTSTINGRGFERRGNMVRSRSCSPMIYADVTPPNNRNVLTNQRQPRDNQNRISKNTGSLPFGDGLAFVPGKTKRVHQPPPQRNENIPPKSKTPSEYSISLGTPEELRRRMTKLNINTNPTSHSYDDRGNAKPFPNSIHLEQMLSDTSSSQKSGTIKSVLKQPSDKFPLVRDSKDANKPHKRVTIKENISRMPWAENGVVQSTYRMNPACGLVRAPIQHDSKRWKPEHKFKVINNRIMMVS